MKFSELKSIGHNIADSLASGLGLPLGYFPTDIFGEAAASTEGYILVDFLTGTTAGGQPSNLLAKAILLYAGALDALCKRHGTTTEAFAKLTARYSQKHNGGHFTVTVEDHQGRLSEDTFYGSPGRRIKVLDAHGRVRPG